MTFESRNGAWLAFARAASATRKNALSAASSGTVLLRPPERVGTRFPPVPAKSHTVNEARVSENGKTALSSSSSRSSFVLPIRPDSGTAFPCVLRVSSNVETVVASFVAFAKRLVRTSNRARTCARRPRRRVGDVVGDAISASMRATPRARARHARHVSMVSTTISAFSTKNALEFRNASSASSRTRGRVGRDVLDRKTPPPPTRRPPPARRGRLRFRVRSSSFALVRFRVVEARRARPEAPRASSREKGGEPKEPRASAYSRLRRSRTPRSRRVPRAPR